MDEAGYYHVNLDGLNSASFRNFQLSPDGLLNRDGAKSKFELEADTQLVIFHTRADQG